MSSLIQGSVSQSSSVIGHVRDMLLKRWHHLQGWLKPKLLGPAPRVLDSVGLEWGLIMDISKSSQMLLLVVVQGPQFEKPWTRAMGRIQEVLCKRYNFSGYSFCLSKIFDFELILT